MQKKGNLQKLNLNKQNKKLPRKPHTDDACIDVPYGFPVGIPVMDRLKVTCQHFCITNWNLSCDACVPPLGGPEEIKNITYQFKQHEVKSRAKRRENITKIIKNNMKLENSESPILILTLNHGYVLSLYIHCHRDQLSIHLFFCFGFACHKLNQLKQMFNAMSAIVGKRIVCLCVCGFF